MIAHVLERKYANSLECAMGDPILLQPLLARAMGDPSQISPDFPVELAANVIQDFQP